MNDRRLFRVVLSLLLLVALASVLIASYSVARIDDRATSSARLSNSGLVAVQALNASVNETAQETLAYVASDEVVERDDARVAIASFEGLIADFEAADHDHPRAVEILSAIVEGHQRFAAQTEQVFADYESTGLVSIDTFEEYEALVDALTTDLDSLIRFEEAELVAAQDAVIRSEKRARDSVLRQGFVVAALAVGAGIITFWLFRRLRFEREEARRDLNLHRDALAATTIGVVIADARQPDMPLIYINRAFQDITGYTPDDALGRNCRFLQGPRSDPAVIDVMRQAIKREEPANVLIENYTVDGTPFWNAAHISPIRDDAGNVTHFVGVTEDVTEKVELENRELRSGKMDAIGQLAGGIAHDFNNYLTVINAAIEMIQLDPDVDSAYWLDQISAAGERSAALTSQLMSFARVQSLDVRTIDLNSIVNEVVPLLRSTIGENVSIEVVSTTGPAAVLGDRSQLDQVVTNIVINARDAMPDGGVILIETSRKYLSESDVGGESNAHAGNYVVLSVTDTGTGIDPAIADEIFDPFATTKSVGLGVGLGLATVNGIVRHSNGFITVYTEPAYGTTFRVYLPAAGAVDANEEPTIETGPLVELVGPVLLVEDDDNVRNALKAMLTSLDLSVLESTNGVDALDMLARHPGVQFLVSDVTMPKMGGVELADRARATNPDLKVLLVSGYTEERISRRNISDPMLSKPFTRDDIRRKLVELIGSSR